MEAALKTNFRKEQTPQNFVEEFSAPNATSSDDFYVDDLLDFSHVQEEPEQQDPAFLSLQQQNHARQPSTFEPDYVSVPATELSVPADDVADLEWLSHFVEDSFSEFSAAFPTVTENQMGFKAQEAKPEPESPHFRFKTPVQTKARSKRSRNGVRVWPLGSPSFTECSSSSTTTSSSSSSSSPSTTTLLIYTNCLQSLDHVCSQPKPKKPKKKTSSDTLAPRRCSHCGVHKTPQWRTGPLGPKTLCNACGVRFKSGRLLPEYRPACSPTFSSELHSNHHRKVLEMRRKKETVAGVESLETITPASVPSF
uniref:GATA transcription factor n=2 Tax=Cajanus cajan TaxID=3821 RepID=A0A151TIM0_CAJCA|nr:GATA transcription factor 14 [Cajanus cajan]